MQHTTDKIYNKKYSSTVSTKLKTKTQGRILKSGLGAHFGGGGGGLQKVGGGPQFYCDFWKNMWKNNIKQLTLQQRGPPGPLLKLFFNP